MRGDSRSRRVGWGALVLLTAAAILAGTVAITYGIQSRQNRQTLDWLNSTFVDIDTVGLTFEQGFRELVAMEELRLAGVDGIRFRLEIADGARNRAAPINLTQAPVSNALNILCDQAALTFSIQGRDVIVHAPSDQRFGRTDPVETFIRRITTLFSDPSDPFAEPWWKRWLP